MKGYEAGFRTKHLLLKLVEINRENNQKEYVYDVYTAARVENGKLSDPISIDGLSREQIAALNLRRVKNGQVIVVKGSFFFPNVPLFKDEVIETFEKLTDLTLLEDISKLAVPKKKKKLSTNSYAHRLLNERMRYANAS